ncbi:MAG: radical SAM protein [Athalassotoga sp.]
MKLTNYYALLNINRKYYLLNTLNSALIELDSENYEKIKHLSVNENDITIFNNNELEILKNNGFLIEEDYDEFLYIRNRYLTSKYKVGNRLKIDIAITNKCNFSCEYCYERNSNKQADEHIDREQFISLLKKYINYMLKNYSIKLLQVVWLGGEPLLEFSLISQINQELMNLASDYKISYSNILVTNGYLINETIVKKLSNQNVKYIQITLDGNENFHNKKRTLINGGNTYSKILNGISNLLAAGIKVIIRINVDKSNKDNIPYLIDELYKKYENYVLSKTLFISIARIFGYEKSISISEYEPIYNTLWIKSTHYGFIEPILESTKEWTFCNAERDVIDSPVIDIFGKVYKCWNDVFINNANYTTLEKLCEEEIPKNKERFRYVEQVSLLNVNNGNCLLCNYFPYCMGLCPDLRIRILNGKEENIYTGNKCKLIVENHIKNEIKAILSLGDI